MNVFLTVDVECYSGDYEAEVYGHGLGLPFIIETCQRYGIRATFFVEALGATRWGEAGVRRICRDLTEARQDIQLHLHPSVAGMEGLESCRDVFSALDQATQAMLLEEGMGILRRCGATGISAFRAGDLAADAGTLLAMDRACIRIGSNRDLDVKCSIRSKLNHAFPVVNDISVLNGQLDIPVTSLRSPFPVLDGPFRHMEISAVGAAEMRDGLRKLGRAGYATATILTHPGEFFRTVNGRFVPIPKNRDRWERLLCLVAHEPGMMVCPIGGYKGPLPESSPGIPRLNPWFSLVRVVEQARHRFWAKRHGVRP